jgi:hypothetical protein
LAEPTSRERGNAFISGGPCGCAAWNEGLDQNTQLARQAQHGRRQKRSEPLRRHEKKALRYRQQLSAFDDKRAAASFVRGQELGFEAQASAQVHYDGLFGEKIVGRTLNQESVDVSRIEHAAKARGRFEQR